MPAGLRKFALTMHVISSVGWLGAVAAFIALALAGVTNRDPQTVRGAYLAMDLTTRFVIVPLCVASLLTGIVSSLGTPWGFFKHYWVLVKLVMALPSTILLFAHTGPISYVARIASETTLSGTDLGRLRIEILGEAGAALLVLLVATTLSVYKPPGRTRWAA